MKLEGTEDSFELAFSGEGPDEVIVLDVSEPVILSSLLPGVRLVNVTGFNWEKYLTPWPAPNIRKKSPDFGGMADTLLKGILKAVEPDRYDHRIWIAGYSLGGLFAVYACTRTDLFKGCASCSGSLWYPNFIPYLKTAEFQASRAYFSLGDQEKNSKNTLLSSVEDCTNQAVLTVSSSAESFFEMNPGNHFADETKRLEKGIRQLIR